MPYRTGEQPLRLRIVASRAPATRMSIVVLAVALTCTRVVVLPLLRLPSCRAADLGLPWDVIGTSILFSNRKWNTNTPVLVLSATALQQEPSMSPQLPLEVLPTIALKAAPPPAPPGVIP